MEPTGFLTFTSLPNRQPSPVPPPPHHHPVASTSSAPPPPAPAPGPFNSTLDSSSSTTVKLDKNGIPKKKRKQLVACDSCRLRRVKCNKADVALDVDCYECAKKGIRCTDTYVRNKPKTVRSGKLIQQAKALYGGGEDVKPTIKPLSPGTSEEEEQMATPLPVIRPSEARLVAAELGLAISDHLIQTYLLVFQRQCVVVDWEAFSRAWDSAGRDSNKLSPSNECLALAIQAWAARFSDSPLVLGAEGALTLPTLNDLRTQVGRDFTDIGNRRAPFAEAMVERAMNRFDQVGVLRKASAAGCAALLLLEFLTTWGQVDRPQPSYGRNLMASVAEHLVTMVDPAYVSDDPSEIRVPPERVSGGTLLWMAYTRDALSAVFYGRNPCLSDDDLVSLSDLLGGGSHEDIMSSITSKNLQALSGLAVVCTFRHLNGVIRKAARGIASPLARRRKLNELMVRECWADLDQSSRYGAIYRTTVNQVDWTGSSADTSVWFRDLTVMRAQVTVVIHRIVSDRFEAEELLSRTTVVDPQQLAYVDSLRRIMLESDQRLLDVGREFALLMKGFGNEVVFRAALASEFTPEILQHLLWMPSWEEGGPPSWTWEAKQQEVIWLIETIQNIGWSWPGYHANADNARRTLGLIGDNVRASQQQQQLVSAPRYLPPTFAGHNHQPAQYPREGDYVAHGAVHPPPPNAIQEPQSAPAWQGSPNSASFPYPSPDFADSHLLHRNSGISPNDENTGAETYFSNIESTRRVSNGGHGGLPQVSSPGWTDLQASMPPNSAPIKDKLPSFGMLEEHAHHQQQFQLHATSHQQRGW